MSEPIEYWSEEHEQFDIEGELRKILGNKYIGCTIRGGKELIEIRVKTDLTMTELNNIKAKFGKNFSKKPRGT